MQVKNASELSLALRVTLGNARHERSASQRDAGVRLINERNVVDGSSLVSRCRSSLARAKNFRFNSFFMQYLIHFSSSRVSGAE